MAGKIKGIEKLGISLPKEFLEFLQGHDGSCEYVFNHNPWRLATTDKLVGKIRLDGKSVPYVKQLSQVVASIAQFFESDSTVDNKGKSYPFARLSEGIVIGSDCSGDTLFLDPADKMSVWAFRHDGGDVEKLAGSFAAWLKKAKKEEY